MIGMNRLWDLFRVGMPPSGIPLRWYVTATCWLNNLEIEGGRVEHMPDKIVIYPKTDGGMDYPWHTVKTADAGETISVRVTKGRWQRNPEMGGDVLTLDCGTEEYLVKSVGKNEYLAAVVGRDDTTRDPRLQPTFVEVVASVNPDDVTGTGEYGGHVVLGKATDGVWEEWWRGGHITDSLEVCDGDSDVTATPVVKTLERNPITGEHEFEMQLVNADAAEDGSWSVPYLPKDAIGNGDLAWAPVDTHKDNTDGESLEILTDDRMQIKGWSAATAGTQAADDLLHAQYTDGGVRKTKYLKAEDLSVAHADDADHADTADTATNVVNHTHEHHDHTGLEDDDHTQYWKVDADYTRNKGASIGSSGGVERIDLDAATPVLKGDWQCGGGFLAASDIESNYKLISGTDVESDGDIKIMTGAKSFVHNGNAGKSHSKKIILTDEDGTAVACYLRGGILCAS